MIKRILGLGVFAAILFMTSCSNDELKEGTEDNSTLHNVKVVVSGFNEAIGPITKDKSDAIGDHISRLRYLAYNKEGDMMKFSYVQDKRIIDSPMLPPDPFGTLDFQLPNGQYTIVVLGEKENDNGNYGDFNIESARRIDMLRLYFYNKPNQVGDLFLKVQTLTVGNDDVETPIRLDRVVGQLMININENIPTEAAKIDIAIFNEGYHYYFGQDRVDYTIGSKITHSFEIKTEDHGLFFSQKTHVLNTGKPLTISITCLNAAGAVIASRTVNNVTIPKNKIVTLTSSDFFTNKPVDPIHGGVQVTVNASWETSPIEEELK